jgi:hypothetical protein
MQGQLVRLAYDGQWKDVLALLGNLRGLRETQYSSIKIPFVEFSRAQIDFAEQTARRAIRPQATPRELANPWTHLPLLNTIAPAERIDHGPRRALDRS